MTSISLHDVIAFVRSFAAVGESYHIDADTRLEGDLGITGDDGDELIREAGSRFEVDLTAAAGGIADTLRLGPNEYFFRSEGSVWDGAKAVVRWMRGEEQVRFRDLTVGELCQAIQAMAHET